MRRRTSATTRARSSSTLRSVPKIFTPTSERMPVVSMLMRLIIGWVQMFATPGMVGSELHSHRVGYRGHVLVTSTGDRDDDDFVALHLPRPLHRHEHRVGGLERRQDSLKRREGVKALEGLFIGDRHEGGPLCIFQRR